jgi:hypothetical protein
MPAGFLAAYFFENLLDNRTRDRVPWMSPGAVCRHSANNQGTPMKYVSLFVAILATIACAVPAQATLWTFDPIFLDGLQETPPVATTGTGTGTATLDDVTNQFILSGNFSNLIGTSSDAHVHGPAGVGVGPAGVLFGISFDAGVTSGNFSFNGVISAVNTAHLLAGNGYINIHSTFRPGGEIRGQILNPVPEPATFVLLALGSFGLLAFGRQSR